VTRRLITAWLLVLALGAGLVVPAAARWASAAAALREARALDHAASRRHALADDLLARVPAWARAGHAADDSASLAQTFTACVSAAGLAPSVVESLVPGVPSVVKIAPAAKDGPALVRARGTAALSNVTLPQLGRLMERWRGVAPDWTVTQIDLTPVRLGPAEAARHAGGDLPLRVVLTVERLTAVGVGGVLKHPPAPGPDSKEAPR
jgi:hypothetical protein